MSHTPGPWIWNKDYEGLYGAGKCPAVLDYTQYEGLWIDGTDTAQVRANAQLIAAAPDLLKAAKAALALLHPDIEEYALLSAAIAKAEPT